MKSFPHLEAAERGCTAPIEDISDIFVKTPIGHRVQDGIASVQRKAQQWTHQYIDGQSGRVCEFTNSSKW